MSERGVALPIQLPSINVGLAMSDRSLPKRSRRKS